MNFFLKLTDQDLALVWSSLECEPGTLHPSNQVKLIHAYETPGSSGRNFGEFRPPSILTRDGELYHVEAKDDAIDFVRCEKLSGKKLCSVAYGLGHGLALTENGEVYSFGEDNDYGK